MRGRARVPSLGRRGLGFGCQRRARARAAAAVTAAVRRRRLHAHGCCGAVYARVAASIDFKCITYVQGEGEDMVMLSVNDKKMKHTMRVRVVFR